MVDIAKTVQIIFSGVDKTSALTTDIGKSISSLGSNIGDISAPFEAATEAVFKFEAAIAALTAAGLVYAFNASKNFESATIELAKVLSNTESTEKAEQAALSMSDTYGQSSTSILESIAKFKQAGFDLEGSMELAKDAIDLVIAGGLEASQASQLVAAAMKGFGLEADEARRYIDVLNITSNNYAANAEQLAVGMARVSPVASQMGFTIEETAGLITPIIEVFQSGFEAATGLRTGLVRLTDDTKPVVEALASIGISQRDANGVLKTGKEIFYETAYALKDVDQAQRSFIVSQLVGIEQGPKMSIIFSDLAKVLEITDRAMNSTGSAATEVAKKLESSEIAVARFKSGFENLAKAIGDEFRDSAKGAIDGATDIENAMRGLVESGTFDDILGVVDSLSGQIGDSLSGIAENLPAAFEDVDFRALTEGLENLKESFIGLFGGIDLSTSEGLSEVIQLSVDAIGGLQNTVAGVFDILSPFIGAIRTLATSFTELSPAAQTAIGQVLAVGTALSGLAVVLASGGALLAGIGALGTALTGPAGIVAGMIAFSSSVVAAIGVFSKLDSDSWSADLIENTKNLEANNAAVESLLNQLNELPNNVPTLDIEMAILGEDFERAQELLDKATAEPVVISIEAQLDAADAAEVESLYDRILMLPAEKQTEFITTVNKSDIEAIEAFFAEVEKPKETTVAPVVDTVAVKEAKKQLDKLAQISLQGNIDKELALIKTSAATAQAAFEWTAKVDIAEAEAAAAQITAAFDAVGAQVAAAGDIYSAAFKGAESTNMIARWEAIDILRQEQEIMDQNFALQKSLTESQIKYLDARTKALSRGDLAIQVDSTGLEPALEMVMWEVLKKVQIKANQESADFLLGI